MSVPIALASEIGCLERASSPFRRVANPMVRDHLFRKGLKIGAFAQDGVNTFGKEGGTRDES